MTAPTSLLALQQQAAALAEVASRPDMRARPVRPSPWLRGRLAVVRSRDGGWRGCKHYRPGDLGWLLLWAPRQVVCSRCSEALHRAIHGTIEDARCDVCGRLSEPSTFPFVSPAAPGLLVVGGCCSGCRGVVHAGWGSDA